MNADIYQFPNGTIRRAEEKDMVIVLVEDLEPLTVRDLFALAGFPWPDGKPINIATFDGVSHIGYVEEVNKYHDYEWFWSMSINHAEEGWDYASIEDLEVAMIDLSRLPASDAFDCLPEAVRRVVQ